MGPVLQVLMYYLIELLTKYFSSYLGLNLRALKPLIAGGNKKVTHT